MRLILSPICAGLALSSTGLRAAARGRRRRAQRRRAAAVLDLLALRDRSGDRPVGRGGDDARAVRRARGAARARRRRRRLHAGARRWSSTGRAGSICSRKASSRRRRSRNCSPTMQQRESRQVGVIDMKGATAAHTGKQNNATGPAAGRARTTPCRPTSWSGPKSSRPSPRRSRRREGTGMPLAERMILALEAGYAKGGDKRWGNLQSAAIKIADPNDPGRGGDLHHAGDRSRRAPGAGRRDEAHLPTRPAAASATAASRASTARTSSS